MIKKLLFFFFIPTFLFSDIKSSSLYHYLKGLTCFYDSELSVSESELLKSLEIEENSYIFSSLSEIYLHKLDFDRAEKMAESALRLDPSNINALLILGNIYLGSIREGKEKDVLQKTEEVYKKIISIEPTFPDPYYILGRWVYMPSSRWKEAEEALKKYSEISPYMDEAYILLGEIARKSGDGKKAEDYYKKAIEVNPSSFIAYSYLSDFYKSNNETSKEIETYKVAIEKLPENHVFYQRLAKALMEKNELREALNVVNRALEISPLNPNIFLTKAKILLNIKKYDEFYMTVKEILNIDPNILEAKICLVEYYIQIYEYKKGVEVLLDLEKEENLSMPRKEIYKTIGYLYTIMKDWGAAKSYLERSLEIGNNDPNIYSYLSYIYKETGDCVSALKMAEEGLRIAPSYKPLILNKIYALLCAEKTGEAIMLAKKESERTKDRDFLFAGLTIFIEKKEWKKGEEFIEKELKKYSQSEEFYFRIGDFYEKKGDLKKAEKALKKAISLNPSFGNALNYLAYSWALRDKNLKKALSFAKKAVSIDPENPDYLDTIGWIYFKLGQIKNSKKLLEKAFSKKPWEPEIVEHIGFLRIKEGKVEEGIRLLKKSIEIGSERKDLIERVIREAMRKMERSSQKSEKM